MRRVVFYQGRKVVAKLTRFGHSMTLEINDRAGSDFFNLFELDIKEYMRALGFQVVDLREQPGGSKYSKIAFDGRSRLSDYYSKRRRAMERKKNG